MAVYNVEATMMTTLAMTWIFSGMERCGASLRVRTADPSV